MEEIFTKTKKQYLSIKPSKHWDLLLKIFFIIIFLEIIFGVYFLFGIKNNSIFSSGYIYNDNYNTLNNVALDKITKLFNQKDKKEIELNNNMVAYPDPSL